MQKKPRRPRPPPLQPNHHREHSTILARSPTIPRSPTSCASSPARRSKSRNAGARSMNLPEMLQQARKVQEQMQKQLQELRVEASSGGGMVRVVMNGQKYVLSLTIDPELWKEHDAEMLQDLVMGAVNQASQKVDEQMQQKVGSLLGGMSMPPIS